MSDNPKLTARIEISANLRIGANPNPPNVFKLVVKNEGKTLLRPSGDAPVCFLTGELGSSERALFLNKDDARDCERNCDAPWETEWIFPGTQDDKFKLEIRNPGEANQSILGEGKSFAIEFSNILSETGPGKAKLGFLANLSETRQDLEIQKGDPPPGIITFYSEPPAEVQNLPGQTVTLKWRTFQMNDRKLEQVGIARPLKADFSQEEGEYKFQIATDVSFTLSGKPPDSRTLSVKVLRQGWHDITNTIYEGDPGYPRITGALDNKTGLTLEPVELFNANDQSLYGIFRHEFHDKERALLFETENPFAEWNLVETSVPGQPGRLPVGFTTSPGLYFNDFLWIMGGSQIDPDVTSNVVWRIDPETKVWQNLGPAGWPPRMGHAVVAFQTRIWVLGGRDASGKALNDVWSTDAKGTTWEKHRGREAEWPGRCLFRPAVFPKSKSESGRGSDAKQRGHTEQIWIYGGMTEPFASQANIRNDVWVYPAQSGDKWEELSITGILGNGKPIASCLQEFRSQLKLFGKFRFIDSKDGSEDVQPDARSLASPDTKTWGPFPNDGLKDWGGVSTFSYQLLNFKDKMLIAKALQYDEPNLVMKVYVPPS